MNVVDEELWLFREVCVLESKFGTMDVCLQQVRDDGLKVRFFVYFVVVVVVVVIVVAAVVVAAAVEIVVKTCFGECTVPGNSVSRATQSIL